MILRRAKDDHEDDKKDVNKYLNILSQENDSKKLKLFEVLDEICDKLFFSRTRHKKTIKEILRFIISMIKSIINKF